VKEYVRKSGNLQGEAYRLYQYQPTGRVYKSLSSAEKAGFVPPDPKDVD